MSVPGLYHHVRTREELLAMAAAHGLGEVPLPQDHGQPWTEWMLEYGRFVFDALVAQPEIIGQILAGTYNTIRLAQHLESIFTVLTDAGVHRRGGRPDAAAPHRRRERRGGGRDRPPGHASRTATPASATSAGRSRPSARRRCPSSPSWSARTTTDMGSDPFDTVRLVVAAMAAERAGR